jgi:hypothetical protein
MCMMWKWSSHNIIFFVVIVVIVSGIFVFIILLVVQLSAPLVAVVDVLLSATGLVDCHIYIYLKVDSYNCFFVVHVNMFR